MIKRNLFFVTFVSLIVFSVPAVAIGEGETKEVKSVGVADGKSARARDEAVGDALRQAVEQGVGTFVTAELTVDQQRLVEEKIYTESRGYIQSYRILREGWRTAVFAFVLALADDASPFLSERRTQRRFR